MTKTPESTALSRERNRIHARKTRQRKKEQMQSLQNRAEELKHEQIRIKQSINEKNTASILVGLFGKTGDKAGKDAPAESSKTGSSATDPQIIEELLRRPVEQIPDATKLPELPALILPGHHNSKKHKGADVMEEHPLPDDGIDYDLLGKDRSKCSTEELDRIRRERNRMHAKRTRDRKRLFMEEMAELCKKLEGENFILQNHLNALNGLPPLPAPVSSETVASTSAAVATTSSNNSKKKAVKVSPPLTSSPSIEVPPPMMQAVSLTSESSSTLAASVTSGTSSGSGPLRSQMQAFHKRKNPAAAAMEMRGSKKKKKASPSASGTKPAASGQISTLLQAAGAYETPLAVSAENSDLEHATKRNRINSAGSDESADSPPLEQPQHKVLQQTQEAATLLGC